MLLWSGGAGLEAEQCTWKVTNSSFPGKLRYRIHLELYVFFQPGVILTSIRCTNINFWTICWSHSPAVQGPSTKWSIACQESCFPCCPEVSGPGRSPRRCVPGTAGTPARRLTPALRATGRLRSIHAVVLESPEAAAALQAPRSLLRSLSPSPVRRAGAAPPPPRPSRALTAIRESLHDSGPEAPGSVSPPSPEGLAAGHVDEVSAHSEPGSPGRTPARPHGGGARAQPSSGGAEEGAAARPAAPADGVSCASDSGRAGEPAEEREPAAGTPPASQAAPEAAAAGAGAAHPQPSPAQAQHAGPAAHAAAEAVTDPPKSQGQTPRDLLAEWRASAAERTCDESAAGARDAKQQATAQPVPGSPPAKPASESAVLGGRNGGPAGLPAGPPGFDAQTLQRISGGSLGSLKSAIAGGSLGSDSGAGSLTQRLKKRVSFSEDNEVTLYLE